MVVKHFFYLQMVHDLYKDIKIKDEVRAQWYTIMAILIKFYVHYLLI